MRIIVLITIFFLLYTFFWVNILSHKNGSRTTPVFKQVLSVSTQQYSPKPEVSIAINNTEALPSSFSIPFTPRKQMFNLSCEFAAAAAILYYSTNDSVFSPANEKNAEELLVSKIGSSQNPNLGVRMGKDASDNTSTFYNLNKQFGGTEYYGVHAPPFIDLLEQYGLTARPFNKNDSIVQQIQQAVSSSHVVMTWIRIGYGKAVDVALSYGTVSVVKGEHVVVITGYDQTGVTVMDPGSGVIRHISYEALSVATQLFPLPFLEVYKSSQSSFFSVDSIVGFDQIVGLKRNSLTVSIENGSGKVGEGNELATILKDFGYRVSSVQTISPVEYDNMKIQIKNSKKDYLYILRKDIALASYGVSSTSADLREETNVDTIIHIGQ